MEKKSSQDGTDPKNFISVSAKAGGHRHNVRTCIVICMRLDSGLDCCSLSWCTLGSLPAMAVDEGIQVDKNGTIMVFERIG